MKEIEEIKHSILMTKLHKNEDIEKYEERWQKICYLRSGDGIHHIHCCELCHDSHDIIRILGGHYLCLRCKNKMRLPKEENLVKWAKKTSKFIKEHGLADDKHPSDPAKIERGKTWKKIIKEDYLIAAFNKHFPYK